MLAAENSLYDETTPTLPAPKRGSPHCLILFFAAANSERTLIRHCPDRWRISLTSGSFGATPTANPGIFYMALIKAGFSASEFILCRRTRTIRNGWPALHYSFNEFSGIPPGTTMGLRGYGIIKSGGIGLSGASTIEEEAREKRPQSSRL